MQMTTREAVERALMALKYSSEQTILKSVEEMNRSAARVLCEHYGFKLSQFFDVEVVE